MCIEWAILLAIYFTGLVAVILTDPAGLLAAEQTRRNEG